ncbi:MAG TPA: ATP-binding protein [Bacteroidia bacterium]|nr:ATP-binding protein [Bacteroidia bacterium]
MRFLDKPYKILVIDDDEGDFFLIKDYLGDLGDDYIIEWAPSYEKGVELISEQKHHIYLIDHLLGEGTGLDLIVYATYRGCKLPMVLLTGVGNRELDIKALRAGADDFLPKTMLNTEMLERTIRHALQRYDQHLLYEQEQARFKTLFEQSIDPIYLTDAGWNFKEANKSFLRLFGISPFDLQKKKLADIFKDEKEFEVFIHRNAKDGFVQNHPVQLLVKENESINALISSSPMLNYQGEVTGYQGMIHDITQLKKAEQELMLADQISLTGRMARMIAHEVRNPLTNITLAADQLQDELASNAISDDMYVDMIKRNSTRINNLINDLLNSTKLAMPTFEPSCIEDVLKEAIKLCSDRITLKNITINQLGLDGRTMLEIDGEKLKIAFVNIITNAIEAMEEMPKPTLAVECKTGENTFEIKISDNGKGMDEDTLKNIFKAFYTARKGGMGLGMTAVQNIILQHKGDIRVESAPGTGTAFFFSLPLPATATGK